MYLLIVVGYSNARKHPTTINLLLYSRTIENYLYLLL